VNNNDLTKEITQEINLGKSTIKIKISISDEQVKFESCCEEVELDSPLLMAVPRYEGRLIYVHKITKKRFNPNVYFSFQNEVKFYPDCKEFSIWLIWYFNCHKREMYESEEELCSAIQKDNYNTYEFCPECFPEKENRLIKQGVRW